MVGLYPVRSRRPTRGCNPGGWRLRRASIITADRAAIGSDATRQLWIGYLSKREVDNLELDE